MSHNLVFLQDCDILIDCSDTAPSIGTAFEGDIVPYNLYINGWYQLQNHCWIFAQKDGKATVAETEEPVRTTNRIQIDKEAISSFSFNLQLFGNEESEAKQKADEIEEKRKRNVVDYANEVAEGLSNLWGNDHEGTSEYDIQVASLTGLFGVPYQYPSYQDIRINGEIGDEKVFGQKYFDKITARMPILVMVPGTPHFLAGYSGDEQESIITGIIGGTIDNMSDLLSNPGKYYEVRADWQGYFQNVNAMCLAAAVFLGLHEQSYNGVDFRSPSWQDNASDAALVKGTMYKGGVAFYVDAEPQISESLSNSTTQSQLAEKINSVSDLGREMQFLLGSNENLMPSMITDTVHKDPTKDVSVAQDAANKILSGGSLIGTITHSFDTIIAGGKLIFPEIWSDSQFSRDYPINIKLVSPDNDDYSIYVNIIVPLLHLLGFALPRGTGPSAFVSPYLIRCAYKGMFNVDMGIISSMSITKGAECSWNHRGMPTSVNVSFTIKELYNIFALANNESGNYKLAENSIMMDYIGNLCGININEPDLARTITYHGLMQLNRPSNFARGVWDKLDQRFINGINNIFKGGV